MTRSTGKRGFGYCRTEWTSRGLLGRCWLSICVLMLVCCVADAQELGDGFEPLFNGRDLSGWVHVNTPEATWSVVDGMLHCTGKPIGELRTERMYQNFVLEVEWRHLKPKGNAGIFIWADDLTAKGQPFHRGIEVQVLENEYGNTRSYSTHGDIFPIHGAKMTPINGRGGSRAFPVENRSNPSPEWNHYRIECRDGEISLAVNGKVVTRGKECWPRKGYICLESEGGVVDYRNVRIKVLPDTPIEPSEIAIADRGYRSLYSGLDLSGWEPGADSNGAWTSRDWVLSCDTEVGKPVTLRSEETFRDTSFVTDVRLKDAGSELALSFGDEFQVSVSSDGVVASASEVTQAVAEGVEPGGWLRIEGEWRGNKLRLRIDDGEWHEVSWEAEDGVNGGVAWQFKADGPLELANVFVGGRQPRAEHD